MNMNWRWAVASEIGTSHIRSGTRLQDAYAVSAVGNGYLFAIVSDGAGSAKFGAYGAWIVCRTMKVRFREWILQRDCLPNDDTVMMWIDDLRDRIYAIAERRKSTPRDFAATLATLLISPSDILAIQVGDSGIVGRRVNEWDVICWPENGEYASTTYFITDEPAARLNIIRRQQELNAFALFSDGVGDLALSHLERQPHFKFFDPMIRPVDNATDAGRLSDLSAKLGSYLAGPSVCERTDDDKTLVLISGA